MRTLVSTLLLALSAPAFAGKICVVDFQTAVTETQEGKAAQTRIDTMYATRKGELERMQADLEKAIKDYQGRAMILSADAKAQEEQKLGLQQQTFERTYMQYQQEMQQTYGALLGDLDEKMRTIAKDVGASQGCSVVLDSAVIVYASNEVGDVTDVLVQRYNAQHPAKP
ncbi:MAG: OmpH family outer membrane protein [Alphaproteobacteria bacterium]|nr:OmpH family outer membrane protein [Alphaproteobacteria bacterium]